jgi:hypothetical protein
MLGAIKLRPAKSAKNIPKAQKRFVGLRRDDLLLDAAALGQNTKT